jgi:hypothetical protein
MPENISEEKAPDYRGFDFSQQNIPLFRDRLFMTL